MDLELMIRYLNDRIHQSLHPNALGATSPSAVRLDSRHSLDLSRCILDKA